MSPLRRNLVAVATVALLAGPALVACGGDDDGQATDPTTPSATTAEPEPEPEPEVTDEAGTPPVPDADLPGDPADGMPPLAGEDLVVVGVAADDVLEVRALPDPGSDPVTDGLDPLATGIASTGRNRFVDSGLWAEIVVDGHHGWSNTAYLAYLGEQQDRTADASAAEGASLADLGDAVAQLLATGMTDGDPRPVVVAQTGDEIVVDVLGSADDSQFGERLRVSAEPTRGGFGVAAVESTVICGRGVTDEGLCV